MSENSQQTLIENHTVDYVPPAERHGKARDLFTLWFSTNIAPLRFPCATPRPAVHDGAFCLLAGKLPAVS